MLELDRQLPAPDRADITRPSVERYSAAIVVADLDEACALANDFAAEHVLVDESTRELTGVIDWSDVAIGDRAVDFAGIYHWGGQELVDAVTDANGRPLRRGQQQCARFMAVCRGVGDVVFGLERQRPEYIEMGLRALKLNAPA